MTSLNNKVAIVTGASAGIGRATARLFAREGARVVVAGRRRGELDTLVQEIAAGGGQAVALAGDVGDEQHLKALVDFAVAQFGRLDIAMNNAGTLGACQDAVDISLTDWNDTIRTNLTSAFLAAKYQLPVMRESGGSIIFTSSFVGYSVGMPQKADYAASKAGMIGLTKALAAEYGPLGIRVNALLPGGTDTAMAKTFGDSPQIVAAVKAMHALKRIASPDEIARSALFLASDASSFTTGTAMLVDGGVSICKS